MPSTPLHTTQYPLPPDRVFHSTRKYGKLYPNLKPRGSQRPSMAVEKGHGIRTIRPFLEPRGGKQNSGFVASRLLGHVHSTRRPMLTMVVASACVPGSELVGFVVLVFGFLVGFWIRTLLRYIRHCRSSQHTHPHALSSYAFFASVHLHSLFL